MYFATAFVTSLAAITAVSATPTRGNIAARQARGDIVIINTEGAETAVSIEDATGGVDNIHDEKGFAKFAMKPTLGVQLSENFACDVTPPGKEANATKVQYSELYTYRPTKDLKLIYNEYNDKVEAPMWVNVKCA